ncbi:hypothetical protein CEXT_348901 [Caerostris extrusa]|uniref:Uncharacterized protein n=1 Tax=Caerostris extrusa TaxID=172846 RepID=A0AAV4XQN4_CAEEX|nr:hypothetical protein CEXT_348901 [Caerostris extrusa]
MHQTTNSEQGSPTADYVLRSDGGGRGLPIPYRLESGVVGSRGGISLSSESSSRPEVDSEATDSVKDPGTQFDLAFSEASSNDS